MQPAEVQSSATALKVALVSSAVLVGPPTTINLLTVPEDSGGLLSRLSESCLSEGYAKWLLALDLPEVSMFLRQSCLTAREVAV